MYFLNSSAQSPSREVSWWKEMAGKDPVNGGEVQKSEIPESWAGEGGVPKTLLQPLRQCLWRPLCAGTRISPMGGSLC